MKIDTHATDSNAMAVNAMHSTFKRSLDESQTNSFASILQQSVDNGPSALGGAKEDTNLLSDTPLRNSLSSDRSENFRHGNDKLKETFNQFVGETFFGQLIASMRSTQGESKYFNGGQAEKIFQGQLDQVLAEQMTKASADQIADPMFKLFQAQRNA